MSTTLAELSARALAREASQPIIEFEGRWVTWGEMRHVTERLGSLLDASGAPPSAPVALVARNRPSSVAALLGLIAGSHSIRMVHPFQSPAAMARDVERLKPAALVGAAEEFTDEVRSVLRKHGIAGVALSDMDATTVPGFERCESQFEVPAHPQIEILTSGTTGPPKHFAISFETIARHHVGVHLLASSQSNDVLQMPPMTLFFPLGNISGVYSTIPTMLRGRRAELWDRFTVAAWHQHVLRYRPELSGLPPAGVQMVLDANIPAADLACIRFLSTGAAPLDPTVQRAFEERYGIPILLSYGATEFAGPVAAMTPQLYPEWGKRKFSSVGRALPGSQLRVTDPETGAVLPPGKEGILEVISPRIGPDWIRTSDVALIDEDGFLFHRGRADGAIIRGGFKLLPETIERALLLHPSVSAAAVVGVPDTRLGQVPAAAIQLKPGFAPPTFADLEAHLRAHVLATHIPVKWRLVEDLPRNRSMKTDRPAVQRLFEEEGA
ncbi:MAG: AMP-dependent synthetase [Gammaproteobacteria bacterium]|nr:AMP-dependent synthetase [Gammaproteobacteria bacterium]